MSGRSKNVFGQRSGNIVDHHNSSEKCVNITHSRQIKIFRGHFHFGIRATYK